MSAVRTVARCVLAVAILSVVLPAARAEAGASAAYADGPFESAVAAYRAGEYALAEERFRAALDAPLSPDERARVLYDLGNVAWRDGRRGEALGWYAACLRIAPRHADARANLRFAREELGLPPSDAGDLQTTLLQGLRSFTRGEAALAVVLASLALLLALLFEALRGGRAGRIAIGVCAAGVALSLPPWIHAEVRAARDPWVAIGTPEVSLRSEPSLARPEVALVATGAEVQRIDALAGWVRVETADGVRGWAREDRFFRLDRSGSDDDA